MERRAKVAVISGGRVGEVDGDEVFRVDEGRGRVSAAGLMVCMVARGRTSEESGGARR
jgi:hypothetical protein